MKRLLLLSSLVCVAGSLSAQSITFRVENNFAKVGDLLLNSTNFQQSNFFGPGNDLNVTVYTATATVDNIMALSFDTSDPAVFLAQIQALGSAPAFDGASPDSDGWMISGLATGPVANNNTWSNQRLNLTVGLHPIMLIATKPLGSLTTSDYVGLVYATTTVQALTARNMGFTTTPGWDRFILGGEGSFELVQIPEPSTYAALFGIFALAGVMIRRRLRK